MATATEAYLITTIDGSTLAKRHYVSDKFYDHYVRKLLEHEVERVLFWLT